MAATSWLEISLIVEPELTDPVAEVLSRYASGGVAIESTSVTADKKAPDGRAVGPLRVAAYLQVNEEMDRTRGKIEESLWYLGRIRPLPKPQYRVVNETDWAEAWKENYRPIPIGKNLLILPAWLDEGASERVPVRMDPGMAFGTGTHPTTQLCLMYVEELISRHSGDTGAGNEDRGSLQVIDIGCGSGILSIAAVKLGADRALAIDIDPLAVEIARENADINGISEQIEISEGSLDDLLLGLFSTNQARLVLANILAPVLIHMLDGGLGNTLALGGSLILSGIIDDQEDEVCLAAEQKGLHITSKKQIDDWVALQVRMG